MTTALAFATQLLASLPQLIAAGVEVTGLIERGKAKLQAFQDEDRDPTPGEWEELNTAIEQKRSELHR